MRALPVYLCIATCGGLCGVAPVTWAQEPAGQGSASGALGTGMMDAQALATLDVGLDVAGDHYAMGFGARLRWLSSDGFREEDWDERSEWAGLLRYLTYVRDQGDIWAAAAAGELGGAVIGHGSLVGGFTSGVAADHRRVGIQARAQGARYGGEGMIDDVVAPRLLGGRAYRYWEAGARRGELGVAVVADISAPSTAAMDMPDPMNPMDPIDPMNPMDMAAAGWRAESNVLPMASLDGSYQLYSADRTLAGGVYGDLVAISTMALGAHLGVSASATLDTIELGLRGEVRVGSDSYIPGWVSPLYEYQRAHTAVSGDDPAASQTQLDRAQSGGLGGLSSGGELTLRVPAAVDLAVAYAGRPGLPGIAGLRVSAPHHRAVQGALWLSAEVGQGAGALVLASELRAPIREHFFIAAEVARLYRGNEGSMAPVWSAIASGGASFDL